MSSIMTVAFLALALAPQPNTQPSADKVSILLSADTPCTISVDGDEVAVIPANGSKKIQVSVGEHLIVAVTSDGRRVAKTVAAKAEQVVAMFEFGAATLVRPSLPGPVPQTAAPAPPVSAPLPAPAVAAPSRLSMGSKLFIDPGDEFGMALAAAILKKKVPVISTNDKSKADFFVSTVSTSSKEGSGARVAKILMFGAFAGSGKSFDATVTVTNRDGAVVFAHNSKKENFQSAAENIAKMLKKNAEGN